MYSHRDGSIDHTKTTSHTSLGNHRNRATVRTLGLCLGASTISIVQVEKNGHAISSKGQVSAQPKVVAYSMHPHEGDPRRTLREALKRLDLGRFDRVAATGRSLRKAINLVSIPEPEAVERAYRFVKPQGITCPAVVSAGGETFMVYALNRLGQIANVMTGNKCASGTGEFFLQQLRRMDVSLSEAGKWAATETPYHVSGRCSVFCKSDCTHATNKGIPKSRVTSGLCKMMADKILELLKNVPRQNIMIVGGSARNQMMIEYLQKEIADLIIPKEAAYFEALGAALWALDNPEARLSGQTELFNNEATSFDTLPALRKFENQVEFKMLPRRRSRRVMFVFSAWMSGRPQPKRCYCGRRTTLFWHRFICVPTVIRWELPSSAMPLFTNRFKKHANLRNFILWAWALPDPAAKWLACTGSQMASSMKLSPIQPLPSILIRRSTPFLKSEDRMPSTPILPMACLLIMP